MSNNIYKAENIAPRMGLHEHEDMQQYNDWNPRQIVTKSKAVQSRDGVGRIVSMMEGTMENGTDSDHIC